jgi:hypothetical protein
MAGSDWKQNNKTFQILQAAEKGGYGVVAPIACVFRHKIEGFYFSLETNTDSLLATILSAFSLSFEPQKPKDLL